MNKQETAERIKVMQAYVDGAEIEINHSHPSDAWVSVQSPSWNTSAAYRVAEKPPRDIYVNLAESQPLTRVHGSETEARDCAFDATFAAVHYRRVDDE